MNRAGVWFSVCLGVSLLAHIWILRGLGAVLTVEPARADVITSVEIIEELPPPPEPEPLPPEPEPPQEPTEPEPPPPEQILASPTSELPPVAEVQPEPVPPPKPEPQPVAPPKPRPSKPSPPKPANPAVPDRAVPVVHRNSPPHYPEFARRKGWEGLVVVRVVVDASGRPRSVKVHSGSGYGVLDHAAVQTVKGWRFHPRVVGGAAVEGIVDVPVNFSLRGR